MGEVAHFRPPGSAADEVRVMLVDDSAVMRGFLRRVLEHETRIRIVGSASNGEDALRQLHSVQPDVVILDLEMPVMDGITALPLLLSARPGLRILIASVLSQRNAAISLEAMRLGASDYLAKPERAFAPEVAKAYGDDLAARILALSRKAEAPRAAVPAPPIPTRRRAGVAARPEILAIGSSTGGPPALMKVFEGLKGVDLPILITQHMPPTFTALLATSLGRLTGRPSAEAEDGEPILPGRIYVAPAGLHLTVARIGARVVVKLSDAPPENYCRPAVDPMLRSLAAAYGPGVFAAILTGMGSDGAKGCEAVAEAGGRFIAQDEKTSVVWGMPGAAARTGRADAILPLLDIAPFIASVCRVP
ncbi:Protein-glutamate methylesterase/protein-glutamine glutaminase 2 [Alphaproteobacteria bacterium SO-S41]|nr:Protein-glutamate methylesterase/protein-glutamine glutaminase 2 [Alphaproteobacteria bacterium SO-S41]